MHLSVPSVTHSPTPSPACTYDTCIPLPISCFLPVVSRVFVSFMYSPDFPLHILSVPFIYPLKYYLQSAHHGSHCCLIHRWPRASSLGCFQSISTAGPCVDLTDIHTYDTVLFMDSHEVYTYVACTKNIRLEDYCVGSNASARRDDSCVRNVISSFCSSA